METRAQLAMRLLVLAEVKGCCTGFEREACVQAARAVLCEEFNDVKLHWKACPAGAWELVACGPDGVACWCSAGGSLRP